MSGDYYGTLTLAADTCGMNEDAVVGGSEYFSANIVFNDDGTVVLDDADSFPCTSEGATVTCAFSDSQTADDLDYTITQDITVEMAWDTNTSFAGFQAISMDCEGADWSLLEDFGYSFPCSTHYDFVASMAEDAG